MASEELARKLQSRLVATWEDEPRPEPEQSLARPNPQEAEAACGESSSELSAKLIRRQDINEGNAAPRLTRIFNPYTEFKEFSRKQIKDMEMMFKRYDTGKDGFIDLMELKLMMEKLGAPQTHLGLKNMIKEVDEDFDGKLSFREDRGDEGFGFRRFSITVARSSAAMDQEETPVYQAGDGETEQPGLRSGIWSREQPKKKHRPLFKEKLDEFRRGFPFAKRLMAYSHFANSDTF
ncbi:EF-hand domain-containing protein D1 isoform X1 [Epinephelus fuscoguttatus]|uniref:EF-hand domain-containing protein D1 isoform X1 n=1 Tax=Epinephelus fuscoguttatus TaxID=293821 RepID=UPI0020D14DC9|nr:EF-hand domain-containing protein D1 isoform X1 [Epinephelus fuscoguttatus]